MPANESIYQPSQRVVHTENATYENTLFNDNVVNFVGPFTCEIGNVRGSVMETADLNGKLPNYNSHIIVVIMANCVFVFTRRVHLS